MRAASLMVVFAVAKIAVLAGRPWPTSPWAPIAFLWQDVAVVLGFVLFERLVRHEWPARIAYSGLVLLAAINVPVERVLSSPLTVPMLRATGGTLADSIRHEATPLNIVLCLLLLTVGIALPIAWPARLQPGRRWLAVGGVFVLLGPIAARHADTRGLERNTLVALARSALPRIHPGAELADWRAPLNHGDSSMALAELRQVAARRNVLLIVLESTGAQYLRPYGAADDPMPRLTGLAAQSLVFDNAYAVYPESIKGLVALLASRYPGFDIPAQAHADAVQVSLASVLGAAGYRTALFHSGRFMYLGMDAVLARTGFGQLEDAGNIGGNTQSSFGIDEPAAVHRILQWIDEAPRGKRFFAAYLPIAGHHPYSSSGEHPFSNETEIGRYRNALHEGDQALGELFDGLRTRGLADSTVTIVIGDHGEAFGQHPSNFGHDLALFEENVRVPLIVNIPGANVAGRRADQVVSLLDVAPTVLELLGRPVPPAFQGESALAGRSRMALFFTDYSLGLLGLRDGCIKDIYELESGRSRMFDICADPDERTDLAAGMASRAAEYRDRLKGWSAAQVAALRRTAPPAPRR